MFTSESRCLSSSFSESHFRLIINIHTIPDSTNILPSKPFGKLRLSHIKTWLQFSGTSNHTVEHKQDMKAICLFGKQYNTIGQPKAHSMI